MVLHDLEGHTKISRVPNGSSPSGDLPIPESARGTGELGCRGRWVMGPPSRGIHRWGWMNLWKGRLSVGITESHDPW